MRYVEWRKYRKSRNWKLLHSVLGLYLLMLPYSYEFELSSEESNGCHLHKATLFKGIELSVAVKRIYVKKNKCDT